MSWVLADRLVAVTTTSSMAAWAVGAPIADAARMAVLSLVRLNIETPFGCGTKQFRNGGYTK
ncbi:MAG: hypothetical protein U5R48_16035 [Gammaproteobacteria bacterium]|nr:hypothetical protein [Gammaproteobacteria bacterium]